MEIGSIDTVHSLQRTSSKERIQAPVCEDRLHISCEAQKKADWVAQLNSMPDIARLEPQSLSQSIEAQILVVAHRMLDSGF